MWYYFCTMRGKLYNDNNPLLKQSSRFLALLASMVYDSRCPVCDGKVGRVRTFPICCSCMDLARRYTGPACRLCAKPFASKYSDTCGDCLSTPPVLEGAMAYGLYTDPLVSAIHAMKFGGNRRLAVPLAQKLATMKLPQDINVIIPVPMAGGRLRHRGFNQSALMARELARLKGIPFKLHMLEKVRETAPQVGLSRRLRMNNLKGAFMAHSSVGGMSVLLLDDVITTGSTVRECAGALRRAGAASVTALSLARTY